MSYIEIEGGRPLEGDVRISGAKNGALLLLTAALLSDSVVRLKNVPDVSDVSTLCMLLQRLGMRVDRQPDGVLELEVEDEKPYEAPYELVEKMRGSVCVLGPLLARRKRARVAKPGGCAIGQRPIDLHEKGMKLLGAEIDESEGYVYSEAKKLKGAEIDMLGPRGPTVTGTANVLLAAVLAEGRTIIKNAAREPEVQDLALMLNEMGARISGIGESTLIIDGVTSLGGVERSVIPDRIEAGTFMAAAAATRGDVLVQNIRLDHLEAFLSALEKTGAEVDRELFGCRVRMTRKKGARLKPTDISTAPHPGFPTDLQAPFSVLLALSAGKGSVTENVFTNRFNHVDELNRLGANILVSEKTAYIDGVAKLTGARVKATDLRACAALVIAGMAAKGKTIIDKTEYLLRGYERVDEKLTSLGADIKLCEGEPQEPAV